MPLVKCETCTKEVADSAEVCPHCGQDQPEKYLRKHPKDCLVCPKCNVNNYAGAESCRYCGKDFDEVRQEIADYHEKRAVRRNRQILAVIVLGIGCLFLGWLSSLIPKWLSIVLFVVYLFPAMYMWEWASDEFLQVKIHKEDGVPSAQNEKNS